MRSAIFNRLRKKIALIKETETFFCSLSFYLPISHSFCSCVWLWTMWGAFPMAWTIARLTIFCSPIVFLSDATLTSAETSRVMKQTFTRKEWGFGHCIAFVVLVWKSACSSCPHIVSVTAVFRTVSNKGCPTGLEKATPGPHRFTPLGHAKKKKKKNAVRHTDKAVANLSCKPAPVYANGCFSACFSFSSMVERLGRRSWNPEVPGSHVPLWPLTSWSCQLGHAPSSTYRPLL